MKINKGRIKYSPFGKRITNRFKGSIIMGALMLHLMVLLSLIFFAASVWFGIFMIPITVGIPIFLIYASTKDALFQAKILSAMTDEEHNHLILEYKKRALPKPNLSTTKTTTSPTRSHAFSIQYLSIQNTNLK